MGGGWKDRLEDQSDNLVHINRKNRIKHKILQPLKQRRKGRERKRAFFTCTRFSVVARFKLEAGSGQLGALVVEPGVETAVIPHLGGNVNVLISGFFGGFHNLTTFMIRLL